MKEENNSLPQIGHAHKIKEKYQLLDSDQAKKLMEKLEDVNNSFKWKNVILRGVVNGIFAAIGATVGIGILLLVLARLYSGFQDIPFIDDFMQVTGLDQVVEYVIEQTGGDTQQANP